MRTWRRALNELGASFMTMAIALGMQCFLRGILVDQTGDNGRVIGSGLSNIAWAALDGERKTTARTVSRRETRRASLRRVCEEYSPGGAVKRAMGA